ncbi:MAG: nicotinate phosphoribosyltransferase [Chitinivibrionales bacterium]|nr:nicotinate phosphoribosyltransferase [Chitinivibrionales bacterium]MBD3356180.1 nicotinate phosphoribosyltransferase [Chitinivibrionales bacterium]
MNEHSRQITEGMLFTDFYQLTMAQLYFRMGMHECNAQFDYFFRSYPNYDEAKAGYCIAAGLEWLLDWMDNVRLSESDLEHLRAQRGRSGKSLFKDDFLSWLRREGSFDGISLTAIPEGRVVHPNIPMVVARGPLATAQLLESSLLNHLNYQTLIATKAARIKQAGLGKMVIEFGLRRAQGKAANAGTRAALIGGADFTSNTGISYTLGLPPKGTHAHSMVQAFIAMGGDELDAFRAYANVYPDDCVLLVDTIDTLGSGVPNAIRVFEELRRKGHQPVGVRLDSGDLAYLAVRTARMLDDAGFPDSKIVLSNKIDDIVLMQIMAQIREEAPLHGVDPDALIHRFVYGVGTRLITSAGDSALDGVYKLVSMERDGGWVPALKVSETPEKTLNPGFKRVWRLYDRNGKATADCLSLEDEDLENAHKIELRHPVEAGMSRVLERSRLSGIEPLHIDVLRDGRRTFETESIKVMRERRDADLSRLDPGVKRILNPHIYHVSLTERLWKLKRELVAEMSTARRDLRLESGDSET